MINKLSSPKKVRVDGTIREITAEVEKISEPGPMTVNPSVKMTLVREEHLKNIPIPESILNIDNGSYRKNRKIVIISE
jgi:hypothetical protein